MIYANNAGTSWPKPAPVYRAQRRAQELEPEAWPAAFEQARARVASWFGFEDPERLLLTSGCTAALALAFTSLRFSPSDEIVVSGLEHHALARWPQLLAQRSGVELQIAPYRPGHPMDLEFLERRLRAGRVRLVAHTMASNVTGEVLPSAQIASLAREHGALSLFDGAQLAGLEPLDVPALGADLFVFAGHKGLMGPQGTGGFWARPGVELEVPAARCDISAGGGALPCQPFPSFCDVGSVNLQGLLGMVAGIGWLEAQAQSTRARLGPLVDRIAEGLAAHPEVCVLGDPARARCVPTVSFTLRDRALEDVVAALGALDVLARAGTHCAPLAHQTLGAPGGSLRLSPGATQTLEQLEALVEALRELDLFG